MSRDILFMLDPNSLKTEGKPRFCPDCALVAGYLSFYPAVESGLTVRFVEPSRPRLDIVALLGKNNQGAPVLILDRDSTLATGVTFNEANGYRFINDPKVILDYLGTKHPAAGIPF